LKVLLVDFHAGCIQTLGKGLLAAGHNLDIVSYSRHNHILDDDIKACLIPSPFDYHSIDDFLSGEAGGFETAYDVAIGTFPPGIYGALVASGIADKVLVYINHRMDLHVKPASRRREFWKQVRLDELRGRARFIAAHSFDAAYFEHYAGLPIPTVLPALLGDYSHIQRDREIVIGPVHLMPPAPILEGLRPIYGQVKTIKETYANYRLIDLARHKAAIVLPYSTYSQSVLELSDLGVSLLIPSHKWLLEHGGLNDVRLAPLYTSEEDGYEGHGSPNSPNVDDRLKWLQYAHWQELPNVYRWNNLEELRALMKLEEYPNYQAPDSDFYIKKRSDFQDFCTLDFLRFG
jgi:hypothetical protein